MVAQIRTRRRGKPTVYEQRFLRKNGSAFWANVSGTPVKDGTGTVTGSFAMMSDITERRLAQEAVQESERRFRRIVEGLREEHFFYTHDTKGVFTYLSPSIERVLGHTKRRFLTHYTRFLTDHPVNKEAVRHTDLSIQGIKQPPYLIEIYHKDKTKHWLRVVETPIHGQNGEVIGVEAPLRHHDAKYWRTLQSSEERLRTLFRLSSDAIFIHRVGKAGEGQ